jgi:hypothetical protein
LQEIKKRFDPDGIFTSAIAIPCRQLHRDRPFLSRRRNPLRWRATPWCFPAASVGSRPHITLGGLMRL